MAYRLGVDVGGTFTDLFLVSDEDRAQFRVKTPSTPADPSEGVLTGVRRICDEAGIGVPDIRNILHGTTVATNAVLESKGARVGLITTVGFKQILHLARSQTPGPLAGWIIMVKPDPPALLSDTREAVERMDARGDTVVPVDEQQVEGIVRDLVESGVESLTVGLVNSYVSSRHEEEIGAIVERLYPGFPVTLSSHVLPEFREYERTLTACMNSYVRPRVAIYVEQLQRSLKEIGAAAEVNILRSDAGLMTTREATRNPIYGVLSGPSGGVAGALYVARKAGLRQHPHVRHGRHVDGRGALRERAADDRPRDDDRALPDQGAVRLRAHGRRRRRLDRARARADEGAASRAAVGGSGAGARGVRRRAASSPTVTDANVVLGYLPPRLLGGEMQLDVEAARSAVQTIADAMGLDSAEQAAEGIIKIVNENMAGALRVVSVQRGHDPREFALVAYGGAGPLHANAMAKLMGSFPVVVPPAPGLLCAIGDLVADFRDEFAQTYIGVVVGRRPGGGGDDPRRRSASARRNGSRRRGSRPRRAASPTSPTCATTGRATRSRSRSTPARRARPGSPTSRSASTACTSSCTASACRAPRRRSSTCGPWASGRCRSRSCRPPSSARTDASAAVVDEHEIVVEGDRVMATIYDRAKLTPGVRFAGPAIVTEFDSTTLVLPGYEAEVDGNFNILITPSA